MPDRPHFVFIMLEDSGRLLGCDGDPVCQTHNLTPNLDALAARGTRWTNLFSTCPVCAPSRSSMVTGQYPSRIGTHHMRSRLLKPPKLFTQHLMDRGYTVAWPTKTDFNFDPGDAPGGAWCTNTEPWGQRLAHGELNNEPTLLYVNFNGTHESGMWPPGTPPHDPPGRPGPAGWTGDGSPLFPPPEAVEVPPYLPDTPEVRVDIARHYRNLQHVDAQVGEVLQQLHDSGRENDTYVVLISDHGRGLPREKRWCYPAGLRVPMIVAGPGIEPGTVSDDVVSMVDIPTTILDLAGVETPKEMDGVSALGAAPRELAFFGRDRMDEAYDCVRGATDGKWFYVRNDFPDFSRAQRNEYMEWMTTVKVMRRRFADGTLHAPADIWFQPRQAEELYDLHADSHTIHNLAEAQPETLARFRAAVDAWRDETNDKGLEPERELIAAGLLDDRFDMYTERCAPLPPELTPPGRCGVIERPG